MFTYIVLMMILFVSILKIRLRTKLLKNDITLPPPQKKKPQPNKQTNFLGIKTYQPKELTMYFTFNRMSTGCSSKMTQKKKAAISIC